jgi:hypothetical protein
VFSLRGWRKIDRYTRRERERREEREVMQRLNLVGPGVGRERKEEGEKKQS